VIAAAGGQCLILQADGKIADQLNVSLSTAKTHAIVILAKLDAQDRTEAVVTALRRGMIHLPTADGD
jgi:DNA-binding NarL/FixJ family response regulator